MTTKGKKVLAGLAVAGLLATVGAGMALAAPTGETGDRLLPATEEAPFPATAEKSAVPLGPDEAPEGMTPPAGFPVFIHVGIAADALGLTPEELHAQITQGKSLAEIAGEERTPELIDALVKAQEDLIESERAAGRLSDEQAAEATEGLREKVSALVNEVPEVGVEPATEV